MNAGDLDILEQYRSISNKLKKYVSTYYSLKQTLFISSILNIDEINLNSILPTHQNHFQAFPAEAQRHRSLRGFRSPRSALRGLRDARLRGPLLDGRRQMRGLPRKLAWREHVPYTLRTAVPFGRAARQAARLHQSVQREFAGHLEVF